MSERIVNNLETVEIEKQYGVIITVPTLTPFDSHTQMIHKQGSVGESCEAVVKGIIQQLFFYAFSFGHVHEHSHSSGQFAMLVEDRGSADQNPNQFAGFLFQARFVLSGNAILSFQIRFRDQCSSLVVEQ